MDETPSPTPRRPGAVGRSARRAPRALRALIVRSARIGLIAVVCLTVGLAPGSAVAAPPDPPDDLDAARAFVGDPLLGLGSGEPGALFGLAEDDPAGMASTTKSWAIYLVSEAIDDGILTVNTPVTLSDNSLIPRCHGHSALPGPGTPQAGDAYVLSDLLRGSMIPSSSEATLGAAERLAAALEPGLATGAEREEWFVDRMNVKAAEIGLLDTVFSNPYGGDHFHDGACSGGDPAPHSTTAREMATWFAHAMDDSPTFRDVMGTRAQLTINTIGATKSHAFNNWWPGYPGVEGMKGGSNGSCASCQVGQAERIGREMAWAYLQSAGGNSDREKLLDFAFATTFHPEKIAASAKWHSIADLDLVPVGPTRAVTAVIDGVGKIRLLTWAIDAEAGTIELLQGGSPCASTRGGEFVDDLAAPLQGISFTGLLRRSEPGGRASTPGRFGDLTRGRVPPDPDPVPGRGPGSVDAPGGGPVVPGGGGASGGFTSPFKPESIAITHLGGGRLAVAVENDGDITLSSWGVPPCGPAFLRDTVVAAEGTDVELVTVSDEVLVLAFALPSGRLRLQSWSLDAATGQLSDAPISLGQGPLNVSEIELSASPAVDGERAHVVIATVGDDTLRLDQFAVEADGTFAFVEEVALGSGSGIDVTRVEGLEAVGAAVHVVSYRHAGSGRLRLQAYTASDATGLTSVARDDTTPFDMSPTGLTALASYEDGGVMVLVKSSKGSDRTRMTTWSVDPATSSTATFPWGLNFVVEEDTSLATGQPELVRLPTGASEGDFLIAQRDFFEWNEPLKLELYRSGPRP